MCGRKSVLIDNGEKNIKIFTNESFPEKVKIYIRIYYDITNEAPEQENVIQTLTFALRENKWFIDLIYN